MTTTTKERVEEENLVDAAARAEEERAAKSLATMRPEQQRWDEHQVAILRQIGLEDATQGDLDLFFHVCRSTGLDPFRKQIYMIGRNTKITEWVDDERGQNGRRKVERWVTKYTIQTGIDGFRRNGREAAKRVDASLSFDGPYWCGEDGEWREIWPAKTPPVAAKYTIFRDGEPFSAVVHYDEFVQTGYQDQPNSMWAKMPRNQTAKCAEAMAYRRAFPDDFSDLILSDAAQPTVVDQDGNVEQQGAEKKRPAGAGVGGVRAAREARERKQREKDTQVVDGAVVDPEATQVTQEETRAGASDANEVDTQGEQESTTAGTDPGPTKTDLRTSLRQQLDGAIFSIFGEYKLGGKEQRGDRLVIIRAIVGRQDIESSNDLSDDERQRLRNGLVARNQSGTLEADITEWLNEETLRQENIAAQDAAGQS